MKKLFTSIVVLFSVYPCQSQMKYIDPNNIDQQVKLGDDFFMHSNGTWLQENPIPEDETRWGSFLMLRDQTLINQKTILDDLSDAKHDYELGTPEQKVRDFYLSGMNTEKISQEGLKIVSNYLKKIDDCRNNEELLSLVLDLFTQGMGMGISFYIGVDEKDVTRYVPNFSQGGLGLPDRDYYFKSDEKFEKIRESYKEYIAEMFSQVENDNETRENVERVYIIEEMLAEASMNRVERRDPDKTYNKFERAEFNQEFGLLNWDYLMSKLGIEDYNEVLVSQPEFLHKWSELWKNMETKNLQAYYKLRLLSKFAPYLSEDIEQIHFDFYGKTLSGQEVQKDRWKRVLGTINGNVGELMGQIYVKKFFKPEAKVKMLALVNNLQEAYADRIKNLEWMSKPTKIKALEKLNAFTKKIGYPDQWKDYSPLYITPESYLMNVMNSWSFRYKENIGKLGKPVDKSEWYMSPQTVNAYYNPSFNEIVFPAAILAFPFFDPNADDAVNYGGIGAVIGHEMTHGFDDQGAKYAADGNLKNWWTAEDEKDFAALTKKLVEEFNNYTVLDSVHVNGELTLGENIADLGGLAIAYDAYMKTKEAKKGKNIDGFTPEQRFFMSWAQIWRGATRPETALQFIMTDPHSPGIWRCNGPVSNHDAWYKAFDVKSDAKMYKNTKDRIHIW